MWEVANVTIKLKKKKKKKKKEEEEVANIFS